MLFSDNLKSHIEQQKLQHELWAYNVSDLINNDDRHNNTEIETNPHNCEFGKWYYSEERKEAEKEVPALIPILSEMEEPHNKLHRSAKKITENFSHVNRTMSIELQKAKADHLIWMNTLEEAIINNELNIDIITDHTQCSFGQWLNSDKAIEMIKEFPKYRNMFNKISTPHNALHKSAETINKYLSENNFALAEQHFRKTTKQTQKEIFTLINEIETQNQDRLKKREKSVIIFNTETKHELETMKTLFTRLVTTMNQNVISDEIMIEDAQKTQTGVIIAIIISVLIGLLIAYYIANNIANPIKRGIKFARLIESGDLNQQIHLNQKDEVGQLASALNNMSKKWKGIIKEINMGAEVIASASDQLNSSSQQMSQSSNEQAASTEEVSSTMEEMQATIQQNADNAKETEKISEKAAADIETGSKAVEETVEAMKNIADKISIISEIAFQTNILALNAAVEAARAGEEGEGFAVVANEVKRLAERSRVAAKEINQISEDSVKVAENSGNMLAALVPDIQRTARLVKEIATSSIEQSSSIAQVNDSIDQLNKVSQRTTAISEEEASSAEELSSQAEQLKDVISYFKITNSTFNNSANTKISLNDNHNTDYSEISSSKKGVNIDLSGDNIDDGNFETF